MVARVFGPTGIETTTTTTMAATTVIRPYGTTPSAGDTYIGSAPATRSPRKIISTLAYNTQFPTPVVLQQTFYYKLRGWDPLVSSFETWVSTNPESAPPSGHTLVGREISAKWSS